MSVEHVLRRSVKRARIAAIALLVVLLAVSLVFLLWLRRTSAWQSKVERFDQHCLGVRIGMRMDYDDLRNPRFQHAAARRFLEPVTQHSQSEFKMCATREVNFDALSGCRMYEDFPCMAALALAAMEAIPEN